MTGTDLPLLMALKDATGAASSPREVRLPKTPAIRKDILRQRGYRDICPKRARVAIFPDAEKPETDAQAPVSEKADAI